MAESFFRWNSFEQSLCDYGNTIATVTIETFVL